MRAVSQQDLREHEFKANSGYADDICLEFCKNVYEGYSAREGAQRRE